MLPLAALNIEVIRTDLANELQIKFDASRLENSTFRHVLDFEFSVDGGVVHMDIPLSVSFE